MHGRFEMLSTTTNLIHWLELTLFQEQKLGMTNIEKSILRRPIWYDFI